jgi:hypothetical protein
MITLVIYDILRTTPAGPGSPDTSSSTACEGPVQRLPGGADANDGTSWPGGAEVSLSAEKDSAYIIPLSPPAFKSISVASKRQVRVSRGEREDV